MAVVPVYMQTVFLSVGGTSRLSMPKHFWQHSQSDFMPFHRVLPGTAVVFWLEVWVQGLKGIFL